MLVTFFTAGPIGSPETKWKLDLSSFQFHFPFSILDSDVKALGPDGFYSTWH